MNPEERYSKRIVQSDVGFQLGVPTPYASALDLGVHWDKLMAPLKANMQWCKQRQSNQCQFPWKRSCSPFQIVHDESLHHDNQNDLGSWCLSPWIQHRLWPSPKDEESIGTLVSGFNLTCLRCVLLHSS